MKFSRYNLFIPIERTEDKVILFNTLHGETFIIDKKVKNIIEKGEVEKLDSDTIKIYKEKNILIDDNVDELKYFEYYHNKLKFTSDILHVTVLLTWECNLKCVYCYEGAGEIKNNRMTPDTLNNVIDFIKSQAEHRKVKSIHLNLFGGEPLINFDAGKKLLEEINKFCEETGKKLYSGIITNGTLINDEIIDILKNYNCQTIQITLDGTKEIHDNRRMFKGGQGSFDIIIKNLQKISQRNDIVKPLIRINIDKTNIDNVYELLDLLKEYGLTSCRIDFGIVRGETKACSSYSGYCFSEEDLGDILDELWKAAEERGFRMYLKPAKKWIYCGLYSDSAFSIAPTGDLYKCWEQVGEEEHKIAVIGEKGETQDISFTYYNWMARNPLNTPECRGCIYLPACGGGCGAISYNHYSTYDAPGCFKVKGVIEKQILKYFKGKLDYICNKKNA
ncbi:Cys-every-fifth radical SAM/SPASM peptide maturase CefB [Paramaledivibacter caminithermalis]|uniref:Radical SAM core domain-containing protein n=1 Tax=Paramaledivibacter caminithermalis (strain DSM 15212 / CIP 107654 / DViRD3) TaxID=1121301 RepID=A0A1M6QQS3_PARC5|nr:Cys-every-fifth radical SAM/SPASM peptide maturase CefB [Paramaledivibacter caminithermalis]SHK22450.1 uncharacterized protein SAMN02745912_02679 [Paramaledivibacter caminithermalis DSM 15212]